VLSPGTILQKRYRIKRLLAQGGMGAVYEAEAVHLRNALVAVKETFFNEDQQTLREQFEREAATLARLRHPALPQIKDHFLEGEGQFLVMEFIAGDDLGKLLEQHLRGQGRPFAWQQVLEWADHLLDALEYIHTQYPPVIHRDIKPGNLKLTPRGELFLIDFGLAKDATTPTRAGASVHAYTLAYAPPEQIKGTGTDARSDLYSLGATLYHLLTGEPPADARLRDEAVNRHQMPDLLRLAHQLNPQAPFALSAVLGKAMALDCEQHYPNAAAMREALRQAKQRIEAESLQRQQQEQERRRLAAEEYRRREAAERQRREAEEERQHQAEAARRQARLDQIKQEEEEVAKREAELANRKLARKAQSSRLRFRLMIGAAMLAIALLGWMNWKHNSTAPIIEMVDIPSGSFLMGSPASEQDRSENEGHQRRVTVSGFSIGKYEVTQAQWYAVIGNNPSNNKGDDLPVENVSWEDAKEFCHKLSQMTRRTYRLPTEAEWEYACRAGTTGAYAGDLNAMAWQGIHYGNSGGKTHPVGQKQPNKFGLHDMYGNVSEWCEDDWHDDYNGAPSDGQAWLGVYSADFDRVNRGGDWRFASSAWFHSASRSKAPSSARWAHLGFRVVRK
jgi:eukaryotic-like serine/threonine-protein kinase